ncbi:MAG TPA: MBL fold metallo-hydrolase [Casimicrobiaceae bacterium]|nr:MBL fold metallo-hydrolase [Casimicrobiaceae bacterium]
MSIAAAAQPATSLAYPCGEPPRSGEAREIAPGVLWLRMPLPFKLDHVNLWALHDGDGWAIVDTGLQTLDTATAWRDLLASSGALRGERVTRVLVTHMHPDHVGMAGWMTRRFDCRLWMTRLEYLNCRVLTADTMREAPEDGVRFYRGAGWTADDIEGYRARFGSFGKMIHPLPDSYRRVQDGERIEIGGREWRVVVGNGHSPEHACYYCPGLNLLISGDQVLPRISSNVSVFPTEPDANPLGEWMASLAKIKREVPGDVLVMPAHNEPFHGLHARLDQLLAGHEASLGRLRAALDQPKRAIDVFTALFSRNIAGDAHLLGLATGESLAHLNYLVARGEASVVRTADGIAWFQRTSGR